MKEDTRTNEKKLLSILAFQMACIYTVSLDVLKIRNWCVLRKWSLVLPSKSHFEETQKVRAGLRASNILLRGLGRNWMVSEGKPVERVLMRTLCPKRSGVSSLVLWASNLLVSLCRCVTAAGADGLYTIGSSPYVAWSLIVPNRRHFEEKQNCEDLSPKWTISY